MLPLRADTARSDECACVSLGRWHSFLLEAWEAAPPGALFLFFEPTVWQHHEVLRVLGIRRGGQRRPSESACGGASSDGLSGAARRPPLSTPPPRTSPEDEGEAVGTTALGEFWWLDEVCVEGRTSFDGGVPEQRRLDGTMKRLGPGIMLLRKRPLLESAV